MVEGRNSGDVMGVRRESSRASRESFAADMREEKLVGIRGLADLCPARGQSGRCGNIP